MLYAGCSSAPSPLDPRSPGAARIAELGWVMIILATIVCVVVFAAMLLGLRTGPSPHVLARLREDSDRREPGADRTVVLAGMIIPVIILAFTFGYTVHTLRETSGAAGAGGSAFAAHAEHIGRDHTSPYIALAATELRVNVTGQQWWWLVEYPSEQVVTANEIHIPAGAPIRLSVTSQDVIHSLWVPQIAGKVDLMPAKTNTLTLVAAQPGIYRGMCAEFCGLQHAHMHSRLVVQSQNDFAAWLELQRRPPAAPATPSAEEGQKTFIARCGECHTIRGLTDGTRGPDLTHLASRATLGAGIHDNDRGRLAGWTTDAQAMKPGNKMPSIPLTGAELQGLLDYLETLR
jgi:cytochrome c oxidase subunit II